MSEYIVTLVVSDTIPAEFKKEVAKNCKVYGLQSHETIIAQALWAVRHDPKHPSILFESWVLATFEALSRNPDSVLIGLSIAQRKWREGVDG